jgi:hypothetical protein
MEIFILPLLLVFSPSKSSCPFEDWWLSMSKEKYVDNRMQINMLINDSVITEDIVLLIPWSILFLAEQAFELRQFDSRTHME